MILSFFASILFLFTWLAHPIKQEAEENHETNGNGVV
jgi:hypothetical protein